jgi:hypothetical protein
LRSKVCTVLRAPVGSSSNVVSAGYSRGTLEIEFKGGRVYNYSDVPPDIYAGLMAAPSPGAYVNQFIAYTFNYEQGEAPESIIEDALEEAPELAEAAEIAATIAMPEARMASWLVRFGSALRRMMPF